MLPVEFEPTISADERSQTYAFRPRSHWDRHLSVSAIKILLSFFFIVSVPLVPNRHYANYLCRCTVHFLV